MRPATVTLLLLCLGLCLASGARSQPTPALEIPAGATAEKDFDPWQYVFHDEVKLMEGVSASVSFGEWESGGPRRGRAFAPGERVYLRVRLSGLAADPKKLSRVNGQLTLEGPGLTEPFFRDVRAGGKQGKVLLTCPLAAPAEGTFRVRATLQDEVSGQKGTLLVCYLVQAGGEGQRPPSRLQIFNPRLDPVNPLPGQKVRVECEVGGFARAPNGQSFGQCRLVVPVFSRQGLLQPPAPMVFRGELGPDFRAPVQFTFKVPEAARSGKKYGVYVRLEDLLYSDWVSAHLTIRVR